MSYMQRYTPIVYKQSHGDNSGHGIGVGSNNVDLCMPSICATVAKGSLRILPS